MEERNYCILCQEQHMTTVQCMECKSCGKRGHLRKDCPLDGLKRKQQSHEENSNQVRKAAKFSPVDDADIDVSDTSTSSWHSCNDDDANFFFQEENLKIIDISDDHVETHVSDNNVSTYDNDDTGETVMNKRSGNGNSSGKSNIKSKKTDHGLEPGKYNIVGVHLELFSSRKRLSTSLAQIGCVVHGSEDSFFRSIKPSGLEEYLDRYKLGGDLLQALHMTREDDGTFLFRKQFEDVEKRNKVVCVEESEAISSLLRYLEKYPNCVIIGVDEDTVAILAKKLGKDEVEKLKVIGFTYWKRVLKYLDVEDYKNVDLEDYCGDDLPIYKSALDIATILMKSVDDVSSQKQQGRKSIQSDFFKLCKRIDFLCKPKQHVREKDDGIEHIEVYSSFRPTMTATISAEKLEQIAILSESDSEPEETGESQVGQTIEYYEEDQKSVIVVVESREESQVGQASASTMKESEGSKVGQSNTSKGIQNTSAKYWKFGKYKNGKPGVVCPWCGTSTGSETLVLFTNISDHVDRVHAKRLGNSLLCPECKKAVLPSQLCLHSCVNITVHRQTVCKYSENSRRLADQRSVLTSPTVTSPVFAQLPFEPRLSFPPQFILPGMIVTEGYPSSVRIRLESYVINNFCPVPGGYVNCLFMYEHYQRTMMNQGQRVVISPVVFSTMVPEICKKKWGVLLGRSEPRYGHSDSLFHSRFNGIMPNLHCLKSNK